MRELTENNLESQCSERDFNPEEPPANRAVPGVYRASFLFSHFSSGIELLFLFYFNNRLYLIPEWRIGLMSYDFFWA